MKTKRYLICFIGIDGTGKTTLTRRLTQEMIQKGIKARYVMGRFETFRLLKPLYFIAKKTILSNKKTDSSINGVKTKRRLFSNPFISRLWKFSVILDYYFQILFRIRLPLILGRSVICDRYIYDTALDLAADLAIPASERRQLLDGMLRLFPRPARVFLIDLTEELAHERNLDKRDKLSIEYLRERRKQYLSLKGRPEVKILNGLKKPEELLGLVMDSLELRQASE